MPIFEQFCLAQPSPTVSSQLDYKATRELAVDSNEPEAGRRTYPSRPKRR
jgi:hypothetical protein